MQTELIKIPPCYPATQEQRRREREIRALKREEAALREAGFDEKAKNVNSLIRTKTAEYREFSEAVRIRAKTERLRVCEGSRTSPVRNTVKSSDSSASSGVDYSAAYNLAGGNIRLMNMLRSGDAQQIGTAVNEILDGEEYGFRESKWSGRLVIGDLSEMRNVLGRKEWSCDIVIREDSLSNLRVYIHENLHARSASHFKAGVYQVCINTEEASVEYMAQQICRRSGITFDGSYSRQVDALKEIRTIIFPKMSEYDFAKMVFDIREEERYNYLVRSTEGYCKSRIRVRLKVRERLEKSLKSLRDSGEEVWRYDRKRNSSEAAGI